MLLSVSRTLSTADIKQNGEIIPPGRLLEPEENPAKNISNLGEKLWRERMYFESVSHPSVVFLHTSILTVSCLAGATAESIIHCISKIPHDVSAERKKKKKRAVLSPN